jgi:pyrimidine operon attenuation protein/uracil phosphoribosyltransferase
MNDNCKKVSELLTAQTMEFALDEMAAKIAKMHPSADNMIVLGMASRGIPLAKKAHRASFSEIWQAYRNG